ncbi:hypothetical protein [Streptomyces sp. NBC_00503]|uniref:hypothetical protein n=1 Tax=Streptomyces sp. NBC_00503 TaxID=2903659 RepID=UPI002E800AC3|nr:hypothetical protein [Streptomyces sp. NBC_00503]WUD82463.1 hypothetical protein OG490_19040 [Streptomyces sp. NBC_00503]
MTYARALRWTAGAALASAALLVTADANAGPPPAATSHARKPAGVGAPALLAAPLASPSTPPSSAVPVVASSAVPVVASSASAVGVAEVPDQAFEELAGSAAGSGRERPGLPVTEPANPETVLAARPVPARPRTEPVRTAPEVSSTPAPVSALGTEPNERAADLAAHILPLGTGFALMGLGFGFMGMRLRRGR